MHMRKAPLQHGALSTSSFVLCYQIEEASIAIDCDLGAQSLGKAPLASHLQPNLLLHAASTHSSMRAQPGGATFMATLARWRHSS